MSAVGGKLICAHCNATFTCKSSVKRHLFDRCVTSNVFKPKAPTDKVICPNCDARFTKKYTLKRHQSKHCVGLNGIKLRAPGVEIFHFRSYEEFLAWKDEEEQRSCSKFSQNNSSYESKRRKTEITKYRCHRAGHIRVKDESSRKRLLKRKGSCKINGHCTAFILAEKHKDGSVIVQYNPEHCNHPIEIKHLPLSYRDKVEFASKLEEGVPMDRILDDVRETLDDSHPVTRKQLVTKEDLHNIKKEFNIDFKERLSRYDTGSVEILIDEYEKKHGTESPFLYFKQQGSHSTDGCFEENDILLVIMSQTQKSFLQKYGSDKVCIDNTHCNTGYDYLLNTILVIDDFNSVIPVAHLISNKGNTTFLKKFFEVIKTKCGVINCKTFMSDDFPCYINAWEEVMGFVENRLLCTWHIDRNWRKNLSLVKQPEGSVSIAELKKDVYKAVRSVMEETVQDLFPQVVDSLIEKLENEPATKDFSAYFKKEYSKRYKMWAYAFQKHIGIDTIMKMEALHREIKNVYFKSAKNKRLDFLIVTLLRMNLSKAHARMTHLLVETDSLYRIQQRHQRGMDIPKEDIVIISDEVAIVTSQSDPSTCYTVTKSVDHCDCKLRCTQCDSICVHMYLCDCPDNAVTYNLCKHIHAVMQLRTPEEIYLTDITNFDVPDDASVESEYEHYNILNRVQSLDHSYCENNIGECIKSVLHQISLGIPSIGEGEGNELEKKALQHLKQALKLLQSNQKR